MPVTCGIRTSESTMLIGPAANLFQAGLAALRGEHLEALFFSRIQERIENARFVVDDQRWLFRSSVTSNAQRAEIDGDVVPPAPTQPGRAAVGPYGTLVACRRARDRRRGLERDDHLVMQAVGRASSASRSIDDVARSGGQVAAFQPLSR